MNIKNLVVFIAFSLAIFSCKKDDDSVQDDYDAVDQEVIDDEAIITYLQTHYLDENEGISLIENGETPLMGQVETETIIEDDISYNLYYLQKSEGVGSSPALIDSVNVDYTGFLLDGSEFDENNAIWFDLSGILYSIPSGAIGFVHALKKMKAGELFLNEDESFYFKNSGEGYVFMPSGLGYKNSATGNIPARAPMAFKLTLNMVKQSDHDGDGVLSKDEDINGDDNFINDDTDGDGIPNYYDNDDDGDGTLTKDELEDNKYLDPNS
ncbi:FKBP-type peptidyl-prolyl cis-trans isomerase [Lutibacter citreus]|uniref:FKBP-type peptidyl-prolyl cis-trans isomerase n=1 Tax=Lutibacter citreus TaxID=2138210 RepID=UPI000DBE2D2B|nr:hypothetical protein [Lutibacter citreus]